jgi:hypothetical protein
MMIRKIGVVLILTLLIAVTSTAMAAETQTQVVWEEIVSAEALVGKEEAESHGLRISTLAVNPVNPDHIAIGLCTSYDMDGARPLLGLYQSFDKGETWQFAGAPSLLSWAPSPSDLWFEGGYVYVFFFPDGVYRWEESSWAFQSSGHEFLSSDKASSFPGAFKFDGWPWPERGEYAVKDPQFDIAYLPKSFSADPMNTLPGPKDGLYLAWDNGSRIARVTQPVNPAYVRVACVLRTENATVLYVKTVVSKAAYGLGDVWRVIFPDSILENPERLSPTILRLTIGSLDMIAEKEGTAEATTISLDTAPQISSDRTFLPIRPVVEALGGEIAWSDEDQRVEIQQGDRKIILWINRSIALLDGVEVLIDSNNLVRPYIVSGRTMLPLRFVAEALGAEVEWDGANRVITITYPKP